MKKALKIMKIIGIVIAVMVLAVIVLFAVLTITEFKPDETTPVVINGTATKTLAPGDSFSLLSWNIGYAGLSETADFFMDGGRGVKTQDKDQVLENIDAFTSLIQKEDADVVFLQEIDRSSNRSFYLNEFDMIGSSLTGYENAFAQNFKVLFIPYPVPPIGKVDSGIATFSRFDAYTGERISLPCPFSWPVRMGNLKRCLLLERIALEGTDKELVLVNLHLEAFDEGEGKIAQTKALAKVMQDEYAKGNYVVAAGDFNQSFSNVDTSMYPLQGGNLWGPGMLDVSQFDDGWQFLMDTTHPTGRSLDRPLDEADPSFQYYMIDGFILSPNLSAENMETLDLHFKNTDHNPVKVDAEVRSGTRGAPAELVPQSRGRCLPEGIKASRDYFLLTCRGKCRAGQRILGLCNKCTA